MHRTHIAGILTLGALTIISGCGSQPDGIARDVIPAFGLITYNGDPIPNAVVRLHPVVPPKDGKPSFVSRGRVDDAGLYFLTTYRTNDGAPPGDYRVSVSWNGDAQNIRRDRRNTPIELLPRKYTSATTSDLRVTITDEDSMLPVLHLD